MFCIFVFRSFHLNLNRKKTFKINPNNKTEMTMYTEKMSRGSSFKKTIRNFLRKIS